MCSNNHYEVLYSKGVVSVPLTSITVHSWNLSLLNHTYRSKRYRFKVDVCGYAYALFFRDGLFVCGGSTVYWSVWVLTTFRVWRTRRGVGGGYGQWVFRRVSKIILGDTEWLSFRWLLATYLA